jgi:hypothetical protein
MRTFDEIIMKCSFESKGCEEKMNYSNILEHEKKCPKNPNKISAAAQQTTSVENFYLKYNFHNSAFILTLSKL